MYRILTHILICLTLIAFLSCSIAPKLTKEEKALVQKPPSPYTRISPFSMALKNFGKIINAYDISSELVLQGKMINNKTACQNLPMDITDMIKTAVNRIGPNVRYALFHPEYILLEAKTGSTTIGRKLPKVVVDGAINECDEDLDTKGSGVEADVMFGSGNWETDVSGEISKEIGYSRIALDLHLMEYQTNLLIPHKQTSMAVDVWHISKGRSFGFMVHGSGLGIDGQRKVAQGKHDAVRILTELSVLQLLGKYYEIPYWRCLEGAKEDPEVIDMIKKRFYRFSDKEKVIHIQALLAKHGYDVSLTGKIDLKTQDAITSFTENNSELKKADIGADLYAQLYTSLPVSFTDTIPENANKIELSNELVKPDHSSLNLQTAFIYTPTGSNRTSVLQQGDTLRSGDFYKLVIMPEEDCYLYIFQVDSAGNLFMLFPLSSLKDEEAVNPNPLSGKNTYMIPGKDSAFFLDKNRGIEKVYLLASREADEKIERLRRSLSEGKDPKAQKKVGEMILQYIKSKEVIVDAPAGDTIMIEGMKNSDNNQIILTKLSELSKDQIYVIEFRHE